jgi:predicted phage tail protein
MRVLRELLDRECLKKDPHDQKLRQLNGEINEHKRNKLEAGAQRSDLQSLLTRSAQLCQPFADNLDVTDLKSKLKVHQATLANLNGKRDGIESDIREHNDKITQKEADYLSMVARRENLGNNIYLKNFCEKPHLLLTQLSDSLHEQMKLYDDEFPAAQSQNVRACLLEFGNRVNLICNGDGLQSHKAIEIFQTRYCQLSGLIWHMRERTAADGGSFVNYLDDAFDKNCIEAVDALRAYEDLKSSHHDFLQDIEPLELAGIEERDYEIAARHFKDMLALQPNPDTREMQYLHKTGLSLLTCVEEMKLQSADKPFDINLHTKQLKVAAAVLQHPEDRILRERLKYLGSYNTDGEPSMIKKVFGALAMFIGAAAAITGGLIMAGVLPIVSLPLTITCFGGGATLFAGGVALLVSGRQKGIDKAQGDFDKAAAAASAKINPHNDNFAPLNVDDERRPSAPPMHILAM